METYTFNDNTLVRSGLFNPYKLESTLTHGLLSQNKAKELGVSLTRNYYGYNFDDHISLNRPMYSNPSDENSSYYDLAPKSINLIIENQDFIYEMYDTDGSIKNYFNHPDEVFVKDIVPTNNFVGIMIPEELMDYELIDLPMIPLKSTSFSNIWSTTIELLNYLESLGHPVDKFGLKDYKKELMFTIYELNKNKDDIGLKEDFIDAKMALNEFVANEVQICFDNILGKRTTLIDMVNYINSKTLNLPIYTNNKSLRK